MSPSRQLLSKWKHDCFSLWNVCTYKKVCYVEASVLLPGQHSPAVAAAVFSSPPGLALKTKQQHIHQNKEKQIPNMLKLENSSSTCLSLLTQQNSLWASCYSHLICFHIIVNLRTAVGMLAGLLDQWNRGSTAASSSAPWVFFPLMSFINV